MKTLIPMACAAAIVGAIGGTASARTIAVDITASAAGTPIAIGNVASPQYDFVFGRYLGFDGAYSIHANDGAMVAFPDNGVPQFQLSQVATNLFGGAVYTDGDYQLDFAIAGHPFTGTATVTDMGTRITSISYGPVGGGTVPEPATWLLMIAGIGGVGLMLRRARPAAGYRPA